MVTSLNSSFLNGHYAGMSREGPRTAYLKYAGLALATRRFQKLKSSGLRFESRRGCYNNDWTRDASKTSGVQRALVASRARILIGLVRRNSLQRTTTTGLISCDAGEQCHVSLRAGNMRQRSEDVPLRWNRCRHHLREGCCWNTCFVATRWVSFGATCVETVLGNVGHGTRKSIKQKKVKSKERKAHIKKNPR